MRSRRRVPDNQLQEFVCRLLQINSPKTDAPVMISSTEGDYCSSVGHIVEHKGARISAIVDNELERERPVTVFLPTNACVGEVVSCVPQGERFSVELVLLQNPDDL
jgi:hypothetical protein